MSNNIVNFPEDQISAVHALEGKTLKTGWKVTKRAVSKPGSTGGNFSVCYFVEKDNQLGFLKAINILSFLSGDYDILAATTEMLNTYNFEKEILNRCKNNNLSKVSKLLEASFDNFPGFLVSNVYYMIFEKADGDVRNHLNFTNLVFFTKTRNISPTVITQIYEFFYFNVLKKFKDFLNYRNKKTPIYLWQGMKDVDDTVFKYKTIIHFFKELYRLIIS